VKTKITRTKLVNVKKAVERANVETAFEYGRVIASQAKVLAPVDQGQLRNSISVISPTKSALLNNRSSDQKAEPLDKAGLKDNEVYVGSNVEHAYFQEYGTVKQPAQPYLRPAKELVDGGDVADILKRYSRKAMEAERANSKI